MNARHETVNMNLSKTNEDGARIIILSDI